MSTIKVMKLGAYILLFISLPITAAAQQVFDYSSYNSLLQNNVKNGRINYSNIKSKDIVLLRDFLNRIATVDPIDFENWDKNEQLAFWINTYNAITIFGITENYPIEYGGILSRIRFPRSSVRQIKDFWKTVFVKVMGKEITLDQIEHKIVRKKFDEPRIHFALVCASLGCPKLLDEAYLPESLDDQLETVTADFVNEDYYVDFNTGKSELYLSSIFDWYKEDFDTVINESWLRKYDDGVRGILQFLIKYRTEDTRLSTFLRNNKVRIKYFDYDWQLNEMSNDLSPGHENKKYENQ